MSEDQFVRKGEWLPPPVLGNQINGKRVGILAMSHIGQAIARCAATFDMQISYTRHHPELPYFWCADPLALADGCDFLVIAASGGEATKAAKGKLHTSMAISVALNNHWRS